MWLLIGVCAILVALYGFSKNYDLYAEKSDSKIQGSGPFFDSIAPYYDSVNKYMSLGMDTSWRAAMVDKLELSPDDYILDLATGTGDVAILIANRISSLAIDRASVIGLDPSTKMLEEASRKIAKSSLSDVVSLIQGKNSISYVNECNSSFKVIVKIS